MRLFRHLFCKGITTGKARKPTAVQLFRYLSCKGIAKHCKNTVHCAASVTGSYFEELQNIVKIQCFSITMSSYLHKKLDFFVFDSQSNCYFFVELLVFGVGGKLVIVASKFIVCSRHQFREQILHY